MICEVCGRNNAENLSICQDCGHQLRAHDARGVAPTPPNGLPAIERPALGASLAASRAPGLSPVPPRATVAGRARPEAKMLSFGPPISPETEADDDVEDVTDAEIDLDFDREGVCHVCESQNPPGYQFCVTCGSTLRVPAPAVATPDARNQAAEKIPMAAGPSAQFPPMRAGGGSAVAASVAAPEAGDKIIGSPVVEIAGARAAPAKIITCPRCHGQSVAGTRFCKYCGAALDEPTAEARRYDDRRDLAPPSPQDPNARAAGAAVFSAPRMTPVPFQAPAFAPSPYGMSAPAPQITENQAAGFQPAPQGAPPDRPIHAQDVAYAQYAPPAAPGGESSLHAVYASSVAMGARPLEASTAFSTQTQGQAAAPAGHASITAANGSGARLVSISEDGSEGKSYSLDDVQVDIGRSEGDIVLHDDPYVSPRHARLIHDRESGRWVVRDLNSTNHIYLRIKKAYPLRDADLLLLGLEVLQFQLVSEAERGLGHATQHGTLLFGSPATPRRARLCQRTVEGVIRDVYHLYKDETVIGRETADIVFSADPFLSRRHAVIQRDASTGEYSAADLDSSNGTYVAIRGDITLSSGDFVRIGQHLFRLDLA